MATIQPGVLVDGRYEITSELGRGGMGLVWLARDVFLGRRVAIKRLLPGVEDATAAVARFRAEAAALASLRHDHVVGVYTYGTHEDAPYFAMEFVEGENLGAVIEHHQRHRAAVPIHRAVSILAQVARGLGAVHAAGIVHRDVKPTNIVIEDHTGRPVLVDFGLALKADHDPSRQLVGTPAYLAPERAHRDTVTMVDRASDLYALGCTAMELLTGAPPFDSEDVGDLISLHAAAPPPLASSRRPELASLDAVIARALAKRPEDRQPTVLAFAAELESVLAGLDPSGPGPLASGSAELHTETPAGVRVLVVDDDKVFARLAARAAQLALLETPIEVRRVITGEDALENARRKIPELVVLDYAMPGIDGIEFLSRLRMLPNGMKVRVLVASGAVGPSEVWRFGLLGVRDFLPKPAEIGAMVEALGRIAVREGWAQPASGKPTVPVRR